MKEENSFLVGAQEPHSQFPRSQYLVQLQVVGNMGSEQNLECSPKYTSNSQGGQPFPLGFPVVKLGSFQDLSPKHQALKSF